MPRPSTPSCAWNQHLRHGCVQAAKRLQWGKVMRRRHRPSPHPRRTSVSLGAPVTISDLQRLATAKASSVGSNGWLPFVRQQSASAALSLLRTVVLALNPAPATTVFLVPLAVPERFGTAFRNVFPFPFRSHIARAGCPRSVTVPVPVPFPYPWLASNPS